MAITMLCPLYPPQFPSTFAPAFPTTSSPRIYFSISEYNNLNDIRRVHVSIVNQANNESVINNSTGILFKDLQYDTEEGLYYIDISVTEIKSTEYTTEMDPSGNVTNIIKENTGWNYNQFYKLQLRFDNNEQNVVNNSDYFITYLENFSEWSQVLLLRPIVQPEIFVRPFDVTEDTGSPMAFNKGIIHLAGLLQFGDGRTGETETMQSYRVQVLNGNNNDVLFSSDLIYTNSSLDPNVIDYLLDLAGIDTEDINSFKIKISATTKNGYSTSKEYPFSIADYVTEDTFNPTLTINLDNDNGIVTLHISNAQTVFGTLHIRRSSSISAFSDWEVIREQKIAGPIEMDIVDNTVGSGLWYRYYIQLENTAGGLTTVYYSEKFFPDFYDVILSRQDKQIRIAFNYSITSMRPVVNRQKIDTLGGRYPKFVENAAMDYKQFSITGLISTQEDEDEKFLAKDDYFGEESLNYEVYEQNNFRDEYMVENYNWFWERGFREELVKWLNDGEPKLYRSMTEGLMAVMLTDITLTPNSVLGRRLYTFSATVYEIADGNSLKSLDTLGIYTVITPEAQAAGGEGGGGDEPTPEYNIVQRPGQIYNMNVSSIVSGKVDIIANYIYADMQRRYGGVLEDKLPRELYLKNVKIWFLNKPHIFLQNSTGIHLITNPDDYSLEDQKQMQLGYTFEVNNQSANPDSSSIFFVGKRGYYQIPDDIDVTSLFFPQTDDVILLEYVMVYKETNNTSIQISSTTVERTLVGQSRGIFAPYQYLADALRRKYNYVVPGYFYQEMQWWKGICVDVVPYAMLDIKYQNEETYNTYTVGGTGVLHMLQDTEVNNMCFIGRRMNIVDKSDQLYLKDWECVLDDSVDETNKEALTWHSTDEQTTYGEVFIQQDNEDSIENIEDDWTPVSRTIPTVVSQIKNPKYNTVYQVNNALYIYYIDGSWYPIKYIEDSDNTMLAAVPIEGLVSYYGDIIRNTYA